MKTTMRTAIAIMLSIIALASVSEAATWLQQRNSRSCLLGDSVFYVF